MTKKQSLDLEKLKSAIASITENQGEDDGDDASAMKKGKIIDSINQEVLEVAKREAAKTQDDIYEEVFIDEVNQELLKNVLKQDGEIIIVLLR